MRDGKYIKLCSRCRTGKKEHDKKPDSIEWIAHKLNDDSWEEWRKENKDKVEALRQQFAGRQP